jgi:predicted RNA-binding protein with PIN domain
LVFDSADPLGDRYHQDNLEIVYTPRDDFYCGADDKIMEILRRRLAEQALKEEIVVATDDLGLQNSVKGAKAESANGARVKIMTATDLARRLAELAEKDGLADEKNIDAGDLNKELLKIWGRKKD